MIEEKHFEDFTVNDLCERVMIRRTTFYKHFADKLDYFSFYLKEICTTFQEQFAPDLDDLDVNQYFLYMCRALLQFISNHQKMVNSIIGSNMFPLLFDILTNQFQNDLLFTCRRAYKGKQQDVDFFECQAAFYAGGLFSTLREWMKSGKPIDEEQFIGYISRLFVSSVK